MGQTAKSYLWIADVTGKSEEEVALREGAALIGAGLILLLRALDAILEAWPLPSSRSHK